MSSVAQMEAPSVTVLRVALPTSVMNHYEGLAMGSGIPVENFVADHLARSAQWAIDKAPIHLNDAEAHRVRELLGGRVSNAEKLIDMIRRLLTWKLGGHKIELTIQHAEAVDIYSRQFQLPAEKALPQIVRQAFGLLFKC